jgi:glycosyltransferase involved in cell wall biosynthesis
MPQIDLVLPCLNEAPALERLLTTVPTGFRVIVVDNGSTDLTAEVARSHGAIVVAEPEPGYGAAISAGLAASTSEIVAFADGDGSFDFADFAPMIEAVRSGGADMAAGRRRPVQRGVWPWHARLGNAVVAAWLRRRIGLPLHDLAPMRVCRREALMALEVQDRRFGYPVELLRRSIESGWRIREFDVSYHPRAEGTKSKVSGSVIGTMRAARDFRRVLA